MIAGDARQGGGSSQVMTWEALFTREYHAYNSFPPVGLVDGKWLWLFSMVVQSNVSYWFCFIFFPQVARDASTALCRCCSVPWWPVTILIPSFLLLILSFLSSCFLLSISVCTGILLLMESHFCLFCTDCLSLLEINDKLRRYFTREFFHIS